nr:ribosomal protein L22 [uncultured bacterium]
MAKTATQSTIITAKASHVLSSPRKTNLVLKSIVGKSATQTIKLLAILPKRAAEPITKLVKQAIGNAVSLHQASPDALIIDSAYATKGRTLKRAHIGGRGKTKPYERITSHLTLNLKSVVKSDTTKNTK